MALATEKVFIDGVQHSIHSWCLLNDFNPRIYYARRRAHKDWSLFKVLIKPLRGRAKNGIRINARLKGEKYFSGGACSKCGNNLKRTANSHCVYCT